MFRTGRRSGNARSVPLFAALLGAMLAASGSGLCEARADGGLMVHPTRIVLEGRTRNADVTLVNGGDTTKTYRISFVEMTMTEDGQLSEIVAPEDAAWQASHLIRYAPRQVTIEPHKSQTVRLLLRKPASLAPGEYRSHLQFIEVPESTQLTSTDAGSPNGLRTKLYTLFGISIPVIVRQGEPSVHVELASPRLTSTDDGRPAVAVEILRRGEGSAYGDFTVERIPAAGSPDVVGIIRGVAVYTNLSRRTAVIPLNASSASGTLRIRYADVNEGGRAIPLAETTLVLP